MKKLGIIVLSFMLISGWAIHAAAAGQTCQESAECSTTVSGLQQMASKKGEVVSFRKGSGTGQGECINAEQCLNDGIRPQDGTGAHHGAGKGNHNRWNGSCHGKSDCNGSGFFFV